MSEHRFSKRAESKLAELRAHPVKAPTVFREVNNQSSALNYRDINRRDPRSPRRSDGTLDPATLGCIASLPVLVFRRLRGVL